MTIQSKTLYITDDGKEFLTYEEAENHEIKQRRKGESAYIKYVNNTYSGSRLLEKHSLTEVGIWKVYGEDPNPDFGGHHHEPYLGKFKGSLKSVIEHAVSMPNFWTWGAGGRIERDDIEKIVDLD